MPPKKAHFSHFLDGHLENALGLRYFLESTILFFHAERLGTHAAGKLRSVIPKFLKSLPRTEILTNLYFPRRVCPVGNSACQIDRSTESINEEAGESDRPKLDERQIQETRREQKDAKRPRKRTS